MDAKFWLERWSRNQIGFHQPQYNRWMVDFWPKLGVPPGAGVFVPMCGKSLDMRWLAGQGHPVCGIELSDIAIKTYFDEAHESYETVVDDALIHYQGPTTEILCGDFFELTARHLTGVRGVFDRGALVAMPPAVRRRYADHLQRVLPDGVQILLITLEYDQKLVAGPPFSVLPEEVESLYGERCHIETLESEMTEEVPPHFQAQGVRRAVETVYRLFKEE